MLRVCLGRNVFDFKLSDAEMRSLSVLSSPAGKEC